MEANGIVYSVIGGPGGVILTEHATVAGNFQAYAQQIMENLPPDADGKMSYPFRDYLFHTSVSQGITYICVAKSSLRSRIPFGFLEDIRLIWLSKYGQSGLHAVAYSMNDEFSRILAQKMDFYSNDSSADKIRAIEIQMDLVKSQLLENVEKIIQRGEEFDILLRQTEGLKAESAVYVQRTSDLKDHYKCRNLGCWIAVGVIVGLAVLYGILVAACGGFALEPRCRGGSGPTPGPEPEPVPVPAVPSPKPVPVPTPNPVPVPIAPVPVPAPAPVPVPAPAPVPVPAPLQPEPQPEPEPVAPEPQSPEPEPAPVPQPEPEPSVEPEPEPANEPEPTNSS